MSVAIAATEHCAVSPEERNKKLPAAKQKPAQGGLFYNSVVVEILLCNLSATAIGFVFRFLDVTQL